MVGSSNLRGGFALIPLLDSLIVPEVTLAPCDAKDAGDRRQCEYDGDQDDGGVAFPPEINDLQELLMGELVPPSRGFGKRARRRSSAPKRLHPILIHARFRQGGTQSPMSHSKIEIYWKRIETAPQGVIAQVRVTDGCGSDYLLPYPCKLTKDGWVNAASGKPLMVRATYWRLYVETTPRKKVGTPSLRAKASQLARN
jgi:hypothetical protein